MSALSTAYFYTHLPINELSLGELIGNEELFMDVPGDWHVVVTDIKKSTQALQNGLHQVVNLVATGSIIAVLNIARKADITVPFFFGGDGATLIIPPSFLEATMTGLRKHSENTFQSFQLELRVGHVPVRDIYDEGHQLKISKAKMSEVFSIPVVLGNGLVYAEEIIKGEDYEMDIPTPHETELNLEGMECRWDRVPPPEHTNEVVSLLVVAQKEVSQALAYQKTLEKIDNIYGPQATRNPISVPQLKIKPNATSIHREFSLKKPDYTKWEVVREWFYTFLGKFYFRYFKRGKYYFRRLVELSDTLVLDGRISTVISGRAQQREELYKALENLERDGYIKFGLYVSQASVMSCYVRDRADQHIHFVDGAEGGYTRAAMMLKKKLRG